MGKTSYSSSHSKIRLHRQVPGALTLSLLMLLIACQQTQTTKRHVEGESFTQNKEVRLSQTVIPQKVLRELDFGGSKLEITAQDLGMPMTSKKDNSKSEETADELVILSQEFEFQDVRVKYDIPSSTVHLSGLYKEETEGVARSELRFETTGELQSFVPEDSIDGQPMWGAHLTEFDLRAISGLQKDASAISDSMKLRAIVFCPEPGNCNPTSIDFYFCKVQDQESSTTCEPGRGFATQDQTALRQAFKRRIRYNLTSTKAVVVDGKPPMSSPGKVANDSSAVDLTATKSTIVDGKSAKHSSSGVTKEAGLTNDAGVNDQAGAKTDRVDGKSATHVGWVATETPSSDQNNSDDGDKDDEVDSVDEADDHGTDHHIEEVKSTMLGPIVLPVPDEEKQSVEHTKQVVNPGQTQEGQTQAYQEAEASKPKVEKTAKPERLQTVSGGQQSSNAEQTQTQKQTPTQTQTQTQKQTPTQAQTQKQRAASVKPSTIADIFRNVSGLVQAIRYHHNGQLQNASVLPPEADCFVSRETNYVSTGDARKGVKVFGAESTIEILKRTCVDLKNKVRLGIIPKLPRAMIGNLSRRAGGEISDEVKSHQNGLDIDIYLPTFKEQYLSGYRFRGGSTKSSYINSSGFSLDYDVAAMYHFFESLSAVSGNQLMAVLKDQREIQYLCEYAKKTRPPEELRPGGRANEFLRKVTGAYKGHSNHTHLRFHCPGPSCVPSLITLPKTAKCLAAEAS